MLITNGVGTGKTFTGLGAAKRFVDRGAKSVIVAVKTDTEAKNWVKESELIDLDVEQLRDTNDNGEGRAKVVVTTYANFGQNKSLAHRDWDLVIADEAHMLTQNKRGDETSALKALRAIGNKPSHAFEKYLMQHDKQIVRAKKIKDDEKRTEALASIYQAARDAASAAQTKPPKQSNVLFMSATPWAYDMAVDYGEGYLFDYGKGETREGSRQDGRTWFMVENFGYRVRYHKLTQPEAAVDRGVFHREFHERLKRDGALWGRKLEVPVDYDRKFVMVEYDLGNKIDDALKYLWEKGSAARTALHKAVKDSNVSVKAQDKLAASAQAWGNLEKAIKRNFSYHKRMQLLEAMKAEAAIPDIKKHLAMGRKVVVFHDFNKGGATSPFEVQGDPDMMAALDIMHRELPWLKDLDFGRLASPREQIMEAFGDSAREFNGTVPKKQRLANKDEFNDDASGVKVLLVQSDAGSGGISLHDTTGGHQRVLVNLGMPVKPTTSLQAEGRTRRVGSVSNAPYRYYTIGTTWEREAFARRIAEQSGAVENLAMGNEARAIQQSFIDAYMGADRNAPSSEDGTGGREMDAVSHNTSEFDKAKTHYFGRQKMKGKRDQRKGIDFFPTPEPLGLKMVEWAGVRAYDKALEPSAGDGAIARYFPGHADRTIVEPSTELSSRAELLSPGSRVVNDTFENLSIVNKYDVVVMNPPFGHGGKTAYEHVRKAMMHTRPGGRVVALVPSGPAADKQFVKMMDEMGKSALEWNFTANITLPSVTFERAGTSVAGRVIIFDRIMDVEKTSPTANMNLSAPKTITELFDRLEGIAAPTRPDQIGKSGVEEDMDAAAEADGQPTQVSAPLTSDAPAASKFDVFEFTNTKTGEMMYGAQVRENLGDRFKAVVAVAKKHDGYYSKFQNKAAGAKRGFLFPSDEQRRAFMDDLGKPVQGFEESASDFNEGPGTFAAEEMKELAALDRDVVAAIMPSLRAELDRLNLKRVDLANVDMGSQTQGAFTAAQGRLAILIGQAINPKATLYHEAIHAMRSMNLFTPKEWKALGLAAQREWVDKHDIKERYPDLTPSEQIEEAIAEEFAERAASRKAPRGPLLVQAFNKIGRLLRALRNAVRGAGFQTAEDVFGKAMAGQIGARDAGNTGAAATLRDQRGRFDDLRQWITGLTRMKMGKAAATDDARLGDVGPVLANFLNPNHPIVLKSARAKAIVRDHPSITWKVLENLATKLRDPEFVLSSATRKDSIVSVPIMIGDMPMVVSIKRDGTDRNGKPANEITSVYMKDDSKWLDRQVSSGRLLYDRDGKRAGGSANRPRSNSASVQRKADLTPPRNKKILTRADIFKGIKEQRNPALPRIQRARQGQGGSQALPVHIPDRRVWDELSRTGASVFERIRGAGGAIYDMVDRARYQVQDRFLPVLRAQEAIERAIGQRLPDHHNAYAAETTFSGRAGRHLFEIDEDYTKPIIQIIASTNGGLTAENVGDWLAARHAKERNARIASINPSMPDGGSGITDAEADAYLNQMAASPYQAELDQIADLINQLRERTLKQRRNAGLLSPQEYVMWKNQYDHYVPLKGFDESDHAEATLDMTGLGRRYNARGPESMRALGRSSMAFNPLVAAITQAKEVSIRAEKNRVAQHLYRLAKDHPSQALWSVKTPKQKRYYNRTTGLVETRIEPAATSRMQKNEFAVKIDGQEHRIVLHDERLTDALGQVGADEMAGITRVLGMYTRYQSMVLTMLNPEFVVRNAFRDFQAAQINLPQMTDEKGFGAAVAKTWPKALAGSWRGMKNKTDTDWSKHWKEFEQAGGRVSFWTLDNPVSTSGDIGRRIDLARGNKAARILKAATSPRALFSTRDNAILGSIERANLAVDNAVRLAAFVEARKRGWSKQDAATLAKNLTVNFNRRGKQTWLNSVFLFFNAAAQGLQVFGRVMFSKYGAMVGGGMVAYGLIEDLLNASLSEEDDDGELAYDKIPDYQSQRNFMWMVRKGEDGEGGMGEMGDAIKIPMPYVYSVFVYAGRQIGKVARGVKDPDEAILDVALAAATDISPVGFSEPVDMVTPTLLKDMIEFRDNRDWLDRPIRPEYQFNDYGPMAYKHYVGVSEISRQAADWLNRATGGNAATSGLIDISPEYLDHAIGTATGSSGKFWTDSLDFAIKAATGRADMVEDNNIPFVSEIALDTGVWLDRDRFYKRLDIVRDAKARMKASKETGEAATKETRIYSGLSSVATQAQRAVSARNKQRMSVRLDPNLTEAQRADKYRAIEKEQAAMFLKFNRAFIQRQTALENGSGR